MNAEQIQKTLFQRYYSDDQLSECTSSHWRKFGRKSTVKQTVDGFDFNAYGISAFARKNIPVISTFKHYPIDYLLNQLLKKHHANPETIQAAKFITQKLKIHFDFDHAKHVLIYDLLHSHGLFKTEDLICIIGDGHGFLGTLIKKMNPTARILFINLGRNLLIDSICFSKAFPELNPELLSKSAGQDSHPQSEIVFLEAEHCEHMENIPISLFINIASMQEMDIPVIQKYFDYMRTSTVESYFYCCNREEKTLPDGAISRFADYPWTTGGGGDILLDELCPWYQKYPNWRPPFWWSFDGPHMHRLVKFK